MFIPVVGALYRGAVRNLYAFIKNLILQTYPDSFDGLLSKIYALVGIFMFFRIAISLLQYLIDPDKVSDKQVGGGKMLVRIVTSIVLLFSLDSIIFPNIDKLTTILLDDKGIINSLFDSQFTKGGTYSVASTSNDNKYNDSLIDNVYAAVDSPDDTVCTTEINTLSTQIRNFSQFSNTYSGCKLSDTKARLREYISFRAKKEPEMGGVNGTQNGWKDRENPSSVGSNDSTYIYYVDIIYDENSSDDDIFSGNLIYSNNKNAEIDELATCKDFSTDIKEADACPKENKIILKSVNSIKELTCSYIYRANNSSLLASTTENHGYFICDKSKYDFATNVEIGIKFTMVDESEKNITNESTSKFYWKIEANGIYLDLSGAEGKIRGSNSSSNNNEGRNDAVADLEKGICPSGIFGITCERYAPASNRARCYYQGSQIGDIIIDSNPKPENDKASQYNYLTNYGQTDFNSMINSYSVDVNSSVCPDDQNVEDNIEISGDVTTCDWGTEDSSFQFAHNLSISFINSDSDACDADCKTKVGCFIKDGAADKAVKKLSDNDKVDVDIIMSILGAIVAIIFLLILCLDVVVRQMKLLLLRLIAPIPVLSYINPNDKIFGQWVKYYLATYADLFIKLLGLQAGFWLAPKIIDALNMKGFAVFVVYCGAFLFAKVLPDMISKIFGLNISGGTFKDAAGIVKAGAGMAAGAAIGGVVGGISGLGSGANVGTFLGGLAGGTVRGGIDGSKGKLLQGASNQRQRNIQVRNSNASGGSFWGRTKASTARFFGQRDDFEKNKDINDASTAALSQGKEFSEAAQGEMAKISELSNLSRLQVALSQAERGEAITSDTSYIDTEGNVKNLKAGSGIDDAKKAYATAQKSSTQMYANFLKSGKMSIGQINDVTQNTGIISAMGWNTVTGENQNETYLDIVKAKIEKSKNDSSYETNRALLDNVDKQATDAGLGNIYSSNIDLSNNELKNIKQSSARDMTVNKANHDSAQQNH